MDYTAWSAQRLGAALQPQQTCRMSGQRLPPPLMGVFALHWLGLSKKMLGDACSQTSRQLESMPLPQLSTQRKLDPKSSHIGAGGGLGLGDGLGGLGGGLSTSGDGGGLSTSGEGGGLWTFGDGGGGDCTGLQMPTLWSPLCGTLASEAARDAATSMQARDDASPHCDAPCTHLLSQKRPGQHLELSTQRMSSWLQVWPPQDWVQSLVNVFCREAVGAGTGRRQ